MSPPELPSGLVSAQPSARSPHRSSNSEPGLKASGCAGRTVLRCERLRLGFATPRSAVVGWGAPPGLPAPVCGPGGAGVPFHQDLGRTRAEGTIRPKACHLNHEEEHIAA